MKTGKLGRILLWVVGSLVALVVLASIILSFLDWNQYRGKLAELVSSRLGMRVELAGDIRLGILPRPSMSAESVRLLPAQEGAVEPVATAELIEASLGLGALIKGELEVQHLGLRGIAVTLEERPDGSINLRGWPESDEQAEKESAPIQMDRLSLSNSAVTILFADGTTRKIDGLNLELSGTLPTGPLEWEGGFSTGGERVSTTGKVRPSTEGEIMSVKADVGVRGGSAEVSGRLEDGGFTGRVQLRGAELDTFVSALQGLASGEAVTLPVPRQAFALDVQVDRTSGVTKAISRTLQVGETHGRLDLTLAPRDGKTHVGGTFSLGIVDLAPWLKAMESPSDAAPKAAQNIGQKTTPSAEKTELGDLPVFGTVDVTIEGIQTQGDIIQQVDFSVGVNNSGPFLSDLQALLPGATNLAFVGRVSMNKTGKGKLTVSSGNLPDLLRWAGYDPAGQLPAGRLATADLDAAIVLSDAGWAITGIKSRLDTTNISGEARGDYSEVWPATVQIIADNINLDAYLPESKPAEPVSLPEPSILESFAARPTIVTLQAGALQWSGQSFQDARAGLTLSRSGIELTSLDLKNRTGTLQATSKLKVVSAAWEMDTEASVTSWSFPFVNAVIPDAQSYLRAAQLNGLNANLRAQGPLSKLYVTATAEKGNAKKLTLNGTVSYASDKPLGYDMRGTLKHNDLSPIAALTGFDVKGASPADLNFSVAQAPGSAMTMEANGGLAGGQMLAKGRQEEVKSNWQVSYDHPTAKTAATKFLPMLTMPAPNAPLRIAANVILADAAWSVESLDIRNGDAQLAGNVGADSKQRLSGKLRGAGFVVENLTGNANKSEPVPDAATTEPFKFEQLRGYTGQVDLNLDGITLAGQRLAAPNAAVTAGDDMIRIDLGSSAKLNGNPATFAVDLMLDGIPKMSGKVNLQDFDIAAMLLSEGFGKIANGTASFVLDFQATGETPEAMVAGLRGQGQITGNAGALNFLSVPSLVQQISKANTPTAFLSSIGGFLRQGTTNYAKLETKFTLDSGVALVEAFTAAGPWGALDLDGQVNFPQSLLDLKGQLDLTSPEDAPTIPVKYSGALNNPSANWTSRALESFVLAGIERKLRSSLFKEQESREGEAGQTTENPAGAVFGRAFGFLNKLKEQQEEQKRKEEEAKKKAQEEKEKKDNGT
ncbi:AsmA family protein [Kordiimonas aestuarii]|uniref:AsmA family protein n=1 Tax=Kordiimonas aestuarii TaxID=1005925 RepID=UPI0021CF6D51|nr:AsmA family protein [Kordiimonas aestuarii]